MRKLQYPIGQFNVPERIGKERLQSALETIENFPVALQAALVEASGKLEQGYRPGGWNIRQLVNHCADSHMNAYIRFKLALTEDVPVIKPYDDQAWAELPDYGAESVIMALRIIEGVHGRWTRLLEGLSDEQMKRKYFHPASEKYFSLEEATLLYEWHCKHHLAHIQIALKTPVLP